MLKGPTTAPTGGAAIAQHPNGATTDYLTAGAYAGGTGLLGETCPPSVARRARDFETSGHASLPDSVGSPPPISQSFRYALTRAANSAGSSLASIRARVVTAGGSSSKDDSRSSHRIADLARAA